MTFICMYILNKYILQDCNKSIRGILLYAFIYIALLLSKHAPLCVNTLLHMYDVCY